MSNVNVITVLLAATFGLPIIMGAFEHFTKARIQHWLWSLLDGMEFLVGFIISIYLTRRIFFDNDAGVFKQIYNWIPESIRTFLYGQDIMIYIFSVPIILLFVHLILKFFTSLIYNHCLEPLANRIYTALDSMGGLLRHMIGAMSQLPRSIFLVFVLSLMLNFYGYYFPSPLLSKWMTESDPYQVLYNNAVSPVLNSNIAKKIPVLVNDSFAKSIQRDPAETSTGGISALDPLKKNNTRVITYFNGVTLDEAIKSNSQIDLTAKTVVGNETNNKKKANLIYNWVSRNVAYDYNKAAQVSKDPTGTSSGSIIAFNTRKGICFDYSCLYISMCRAVGLKVRLITGLGYSGVAWGDHAWNQVYSAEEDRWINVDATFGTNGNYFDKPDFNVDHRYAELQGEW